MKTFLIISSSIFLIILTSGCGSTRIKGDPGLYALAAGGGAATGYAIDKDSVWAPVAGAVGGMLAYGAYAELTEPTDQELYEAYEQGKREARVETAKEFWVNETDGDGFYYETNKEKKDGQRYRKIQEPWENQGVNYGAYYQPVLEE